MRLEETGIRITDDAVLAYNASGEVIKTYPKRTRPSTLFTLRSMGDITEAMFTAGIRYSRLYEAAGRAPKYAGGDPTKPKVDGSGSAPDELSGNVSAQVTLYAIRDEAIGERGMTMLDEICGRDITMTEYRDLARRRWQAVIRELCLHLDRLDHWFRKVRSDSKRP
jgi:hypothetical protein